MAGTTYRYELRQNNQILATGHLTCDEQPQVGHPLRIGRHNGIIRTVERVVGSSEHRLVIQLHDTAPRTDNEHD